MEGATDSGEDILGMDIDYNMFWQKRRIFLWGGISVGVSPWKIFYIFSFKNQLKISIYCATVQLK